MKEIQPLGDESKILEVARENAPIRPSGVVAPAGISHDDPNDKVSQSQIEKSNDKIPSKNPSLFRFLILSLMIVEALMLTSVYVIPYLLGGSLGWAYVAIGLNALLGIPIVIIGLATLVCSIYFLWKKQPSVTWKLLTFVSIAMALLSLKNGLVGVELIAQEAQFQAQAKQIIEQSEERRARASKEISKEYAMQLLLSCTLKGFYYTNQNDKEYGNWGELSKTGIVLTDFQEKPYRVSVADRVVVELLPTVREAQAKCKGWPQVWHDGRYEINDAIENS